MIINQCSPSVEEFQKLFDSIEWAEVIEALDNTISFQGFSF